MEGDNMLKQNFTQVLDTVIKQHEKLNPKWLLKFLGLSIVYPLIFAGCTNSQQHSVQVNKPVAAYQFQYNAETNKLSIKSINVSPPAANQTISGLAGVFQPGSTILAGNLVTAPIYIVNNSSNTWTGVEMQAYSIISGSPTVANADLGINWAVDNPVCTTSGCGAWGWLFTTGTAGSAYTITLGGQSLNKVIGFDATSDFKARVYIYANVPVITSINQSNAIVGQEVTISGYNFGTTPGQVTFSGTTASVVSWSNNSIVATVPNITGQTGAITGNLVVKTTDANTPYSNPIALTSYIYTTYTVGTSPYDIAIDASGNIWVTNSGDSTVTKLSSSGSTIGTYPAGTYPYGMAIDASGNVWVADDGGSTVTKLSSSGSTIGTYTGGNAPDGIAIDASGNVWVVNYLSDTAGNSVTELSSSGSIIGKYPVGATAYDIAIDKSGNSWVTNNGGNSVTELSSSGSILGTYQVGSAPVGIAIDSSGNVWVSNNYSNSVTELSSSGSTIGTYPVGNTPEGVAIDASGNVWVTNNLDNTVTELNSSGNTIGTYPVGNAPDGIAIDAAGNVWVVNVSDGMVTKLVGVTKGPQFFPYTGPQFPGGGNF
jgi:streptogramin lyase